MGGKLLKEIHKVRPFDCLQQEVFLNLIRTADHLMRGFEVLLKPYNLSPTQYNILRILRGAGDCGITCKGIGEHLITRDPDITRLLDRLEARNLITRQRDTKDRRVVSTRLTPEGAKILRELDKPVMEMHRSQLAHMSEMKITQLIDLLEEVRSAE
ncbi:MAG TPA: MarR family transcriptional regulator [Phycisphaerae bacterium]|nr:MarR family transcriptional regulator [Phycisphaerae bacterium]